jgi:hypothetical protein
MELAVRLPTPCGGRHTSRVPYEEEYTMSQSLVLVHWNEAEAKDLAKELSTAGWTVMVEHGTGTVKMKDLKTQPPHAVVISLRRLPSHGREWADALWYTKWGRQIPLVFVDGDEEKTDKLREKFLAARFIAWKSLATELAALPSASA